MISYMGILNVTSDSFSDGGCYLDPERAYEHAQRLIADGANFLDIGGESTRPGFTPVSWEDELGRLKPVVERLCATSSIPISIDTTKSKVADRMLSLGATIVNDIHGLQGDPDMVHVVKAHKAGIVVTYFRKEKDPKISIMDDCHCFFNRSLELINRHQLQENHIWFDPGFGFGKTPEQQTELLLKLDELKKYGYPILVGLSRKSILGLWAQQLFFKDRALQKVNGLGATLAANYLATQHGAVVLRVHDVFEHRQFFDSLSYLNQFSQI